MYMFHIFYLALTGTADPVTQKVICSTLAVQDATKLIAEALLGGS